MPFSNPLPKGVKMCMLANKDQRTCPNSPERIKYGRCMSILQENKHQPPLCEQTNHGHISEQGLPVFCSPSYLVFLPHMTVFKSADESPRTQCLNTLHVNVTPQHIPNFPLLHFMGSWDYWLTLPYSFWAYYQCSMCSHFWLGQIFLVNMLQHNFFSFIINFSFLHVIFCFLKFIFSS